MSPIYKVSYVVTGNDHPGTIANVDRPPKVGDIVRLGDQSYTVTEVVDLIPARGEFHYLHATLAPARA
ncbi:MAG: hypothetical protein A2Y93_01865 [Chloroflexi bacterium RBG_13_68_17]|jgi:hypothetical protein|nr:MAG: hypothetical protein A2Y93_01865 [Chloroflexi bacterium RBG_13_68_17]